MGQSGLKHDRHQIKCIVESRGGTIPSLIAPAGGARWRVRLGAVGGRTWPGLSAPNKGTKVMAQQLDETTSSEGVQVLHVPKIVGVNVGTDGGSEQDDGYDEEWTEEETQGTGWAPPIPMTAGGLPCKNDDEIPHHLMNVEEDGSQLLLPKAIVELEPTMSEIRAFMPYLQRGAIRSAPRPKKGQLYADVYPQLCDTIDEELAGMAELQKELFIAFRESARMDKEMALTLDSVDVTPKGDWLHKLGQMVRDREGTMVATWL